MSKSINQKLAEFGLRIEVKQISELKRYSGNPRVHDERSVQAIQRSIQAFGFKNVVVVDSDYEVIAGHGRLDALERIGKTEVPVLVATDLDKWQAAALRIADNKATDVSTWDYDVLKEEIQTLEQEMNLEVLGFTAMELESLQKGINPDEFDPMDEWKGMPAYQNEDQRGYQIIKVHFRNEKDVQKFAKLIDQKITPRTRALWYPERKYEKTSGKGYVSES